MYGQKFVFRGQVGDITAHDNWFLQYIGVPIQYDTNLEIWYLQALQ